MVDAARSAHSLERTILRRVGEAVADYSLIREGDRIAVGLSGGKDSFGLLDVLLRLKARAPVSFDIFAVTVHNGSPNFRSDVLEGWLRERHVDFHLEKTRILEIIEEKKRPGSSYCSMCARLRRGALYGAVAALGCNRLALAHHLDDAAETLMMNIFFGGRLKAMPPKLLAENGRVSVIRPLIYVPESLMREYAALRGFPLIDCGCGLCSAKEHERSKMKALIEKVAKRHPEVRGSILSALRTVEPRFLFDRSLHDFNGEDIP